MKDGRGPTAQKFDIGCLATGEGFYGRLLIPDEFSSLSPLRCVPRPHPIIVVTALLQLVLSIDSFLVVLLLRSRKQHTSTEQRAATYYYERAD